MFTTTKNIILASGSPRRQEFFIQHRHSPPGKDHIRLGENRGVVRDRFPGLRRGVDVDELLDLLLL